MSQKLLSDATYYYDTLMSSYVPADGVQIFRALEMLMPKYNALAATVAQALDYQYDSDEAAKTMRFIQARFQIENNILSLKERLNAM